MYRSMSTSFPASWAGVITVSRRVGGHQVRQRPWRPYVDVGSGQVPYQLV